MSTENKTEEKKTEENEKQTSDLPEKELSGQNLQDIADEQNKLES